MKKMNNTKLVNRYLGFLAILFIGFSSCQKDVSSDDVAPGKAIVKLNLQESIVQDDDQENGSKSSTRSSGTTPVVKDTTMMFGGYMVDVQLVDESIAAARGIQTSTSKSNGGIKAASVVKQNKIEDGVKYRMVAFKENGEFFAQKDYVHGQESVQDSMEIDAGFTYHFIVYSISSKTDAPPAITYEGGVQNFENAKLSGVTQDLMVFVLKNKKISHGTTRLDVIMQHKFSMITTTINMGSMMNGHITNLSNVRFSGTSASADYKFDTNAITYNNQNAGSQTVTWPDLGSGLRTVTSNPTIVINPTSTDRSLVFGRFAMDDEDLTNYTVPAIKVTPGHKYNLILNFRTCTQEAELGKDDLNWSYKETSDQSGIMVDGVFRPNGYVLSKTFNAPYTNYGFTFDFTQLDNAFNMKINGEWMVLDEDEEQIQFQTYDNTANGEGIITRNIEFIDGEEYSDKNGQANEFGIKTIWDMRGTTAKPMIRVSISRSGQISILGSKTDGGELIQLVLKNKARFNPNIKWNRDAANVIEVTQKVSNNTIIQGRGYGKQKVGCPVITR